MSKKKTLFIVVFLTLGFLPFFVQAQNSLGQSALFNINSTHDLQQRSELTAVLERISPTAYWYLDEGWWTDLGPEEKAEINQSLDSLILEFEDKIYPTLTRTFGSEWTPGIDKDTRITVLIHPMKKESGGYFNSADEYPKTQLPLSNEREMIYLNAVHLNDPRAKSFLAHEMIHLITFNQKDRTFGVSEDVWLNEARAEYAPTFLGYDEEYQGSNLQNRVKNFLEKPSHSLTEWKNVPYDYGVVNLFTQYLVDHYGIGILVDSLKSRKTGIASINQALAQLGFTTNFSQIFTDWAIAVLVNDCSIFEKYCYLNQNLGNLRVVPLVNYLPFVGESVLSVNNTTKDWSGNWHRFIGGKGTLEVTFQAGNAANFKIPYIVQYSDGRISVDHLAFDGNREGKITIENFGSEVLSLTIIPIAQNKISGFSSSEPFYSFSWTASSREEKPAPEIVIPSLPPLSKPVSQMSRSELLARIAEVEKVLLALQKLLLEIEGGISCQRITQDLYFGMTGSPQVKCLQEFLKSQGPSIYPEGITNGNFYTLTQKAVIRFQEKYAAEILAPWGITRGTGYVGSTTRAKINELLWGLTS